jgi:hypothetical protein
VRALKKDLGFLLPIVLLLLTTLLSIERIIVIDSKKNLILRESVTDVSIGERLDFYRSATYEMCDTQVIEKSKYLTF